MISYIRSKGALCWIDQTALRCAHRPVIGCIQRVMHLEGPILLDGGLESGYSVGKIGLLDPIEQDGSGKQLFKGLKLFPSF